MPGLGGRFSTVIKAKISRMLDRAEDPSETLDYGYQKQVELTENEKKLRTKIEAFRTKKEVIKAQYSAAEAQVKISEAAHGVGEQMADVGLAIQRAEDKTEQMRARAGAVEELEAAGTFEDITQLGSGQDDIDRELAQLGAGAQVDDELAKMKAELGSGGGEAPALGEGKEG